MLNQTPNILPNSSDFEGDEMVISFYDLQLYCSGVGVGTNLILSLNAFTRISMWQSANKLYIFLTF